MSYELVVDLKGGRLEIEADSLADLEKRIAALDVPKLEGLLADARRGLRAPATARKAKAAKASAKRKAPAKRRTPAARRRR